MNARLFWPLPVLALAAVAISLWTADHNLAAGAAGVAGVLGGAYLVVLLYPRIHWGLPPLPVFDADPLLLLAKAFRAGRYGRLAILSRLHGLEPIGGVDLAAQGLEEERILDASDEEFLGYLDRRLAEVERRT
jgi:hypothetical protein